MAIEGPLRELGIHDVFQLLDLSRKTGRLHVRSALRDNEGTVEFRNGRVIGATIRSNPHRIGQMLLKAGKITEAELERARLIHERSTGQRRLGDILVDMGALAPRELERQVRRQIEAVVFELMSWQEGFFSFVEVENRDAPGGAERGLPVDALLMEAARRIDEWPRIAQRVPSLLAVPVLAEPQEEHQTVLDLRPNEWELLAAIDRTTDIRSIAARLGISEFDAARVVYGLVATGVVTLVQQEVTHDVPARDEVTMLMADAREALRRGDLSQAIQYWQRVLMVDPESEFAVQARDALAQAARLNELVEVANVD
jgi:hypothetical protein